MYPAYKPRSVLNEYAIVFFALLNEGYRQRAAYYLQLATIALLPNQEEKFIKEYLRELQWASQRPDDILKTDNKGSSPADIKRLLRG